MDNSGFDYDEVINGAIEENVMDEESYVQHKEALSRFRERDLDAQYMETLSKIQDPALKAEEKAKWKEGKTRSMLTKRAAKEALAAPKRKWSRGVR